MKVLAVDSSSATASVAILDEEKIIASYFINAGLTHSQTLAPMVESALKNSKISPEQIDLYAATNGPGSFTGLRIGMSTVEAMALAVSKPCVGVSSLYSLAYNILSYDNILCACMDARRDQVYNSIFKVENNKIIRLTQDRAIDISSLKSELERFEGKIEIVGDGAEICYNSFIKDSPNSSKYILSNEKSRYIHASNVGALALETYNDSEIKNNLNLEVNYIKIPQAERLLKEKKLNL